MPPGLLGTLSSVKLCGEPQAAQGTCGPESLIGHTIVSVGLGGDPYTVKGGEVFITGPYKGAPYGLSIVVNPAKAGPFNLGKGGRAREDRSGPNGCASDDRERPVARTMLDGIPLQIKHVNVSIDRPEFTFNPTQLRADEATGGARRAAQARPRTCINARSRSPTVRRLAFKPNFTVSTSGKTSRTEGASLHVKLTLPQSAQGTEANIGKVKVSICRSSCRRR